MTRKDGARQNQHYVPKFLLRNFVDPTKNPNKEQIWVFDKSDSSIFQTNLRNVGAECGFYDTDSYDDPIVIENVLGELESHAAPSVRKITEQRSLCNLSPEEREWLSILCAVQFMRVPNAREKQRFMDDFFKRKIVESGGDVNKVEGYKPMTAKDLREFAIFMMLRAAKDFAPHFSNKVCLLLETDMSDPFFVSDNPIALHNENDFRPYGNLGLAVPGIELYFPITSTLTLTFWDTSVCERLVTSRMHISGAEELIDGRRPAVARAVRSRS